MLPNLLLSPAWSGALRARPYAWLRGRDLAAGSVAAWADWRGNGLSAGQATMSAQPTATANQINGQTAVVFDGVDDFLSLGTGSGFNFSAGGEVFLVLNLAAPGPSQEEWVFSRDTSGGRAYAFGATPGSGNPSPYGELQINGSSTVGGGNGTIVPGSWQIASFRGNATLGLICSVNGADGTAEAWVTPGTTTSTDTRLGSRQYPGFEGFAEVSIAEFLYFPTVLQAGDRAAYLDYLAGKFAL